MTMGGDELKAHLEYFGELSHMVVVVVGEQYGSDLHGELVGFFEKWRDRPASVNQDGCSTRLVGDKESVGQPLRML